jgi:hypothetical protein
MSNAKKDGERKDRLTRHDYVPYGEEIPGGSYRRGAQFGAADGVRQRFTGQERDTENAPALDYFSARYIAAVLGRFGSVNPGNAGADPTDPQNLEWLRLRAK